MDNDQLTARIGCNILKYREQLGMTQAQLAEQVGVSTAFLSRVERGEKSMKIHTLYKLADALCVSCDALMYPESADARLNTILRMLQSRSEPYLAGVEDLLRVWDRHFPDEGQQNSAKAK